MGKRKKASKPMAAKKEKLPTTFQCLFCNHENSVSVTLEKKLGIGRLNCKVCGQDFQTNINFMSAGVDVYADWIDACDAVAKESAADTGPKETYRGSGPARRASGVAAGGNGDDEEDDGGENDKYDGGDGFVVDDEMDAEGEYDE
ncbi:Elf1-domain-containing protein [Lophium mytilinum]|uniref:Transcription elongation factor 1 homolog n=1 Tax=Lophium mytilinum TaxID=390894 RepID=A0A6A6QD86_9PEZI|nr:Elf1-domain-containing protein [Lophium mytilinum]